MSSIYSGLKLQRTKNAEQAAFDQRAQARREKYPELYKPVKSVKTVDFGDALGASSGIIGAASLLNPALAPAAAAAGIGYGTYKLGQSFNLW